VPPGDKQSCVICADGVRMTPRQWASCASPHDGGREPDASWLLITRRRSSGWSCRGSASSPLRSCRLPRRDAGRPTRCSRRSLKLLMVAEGKTRELAGSSVEGLGRLRPAHRISHLPGAERLRFRNGAWGPLEAAAAKQAAERTPLHDDTGGRCGGACSSPAGLDDLERPPGIWTVTARPSAPNVNGD
jgi:hypothetical protein